MTVTKRYLLEALEKADMDAVIFIDDGIDSIECRGVRLVESAATDENEDVSTQADASYVPDGSIVLRLANG